MCSLTSYSHNEFNLQQSCSFTSNRYALFLIIKKHRQDVPSNMVMQRVHFFKESILCFGLEIFCPWIFCIYTYMYIFPYNIYVTSIYMMLHYIIHTILYSVHYIRYILFYIYIKYIILYILYYIIFIPK